MSQPRIRVLHVISGRMFGGGQRVVQDLMRVLPNMGELEVDLCLLGESGGHFAEFKRRVVPYDGNYRNPLSAWQSVRALRRLVRELKSDILHTHGWDAEIIGGFAAWGLPTRHFSHIHDTPRWVASPRLKHRIRRILTRLLLHHAGTTWIACSQAVADYVCRYLKFPRCSVHVVHNGVDLSRFPAVGRHTWVVRGLEFPFVVGTAARLTPGKGIEFLIQAVGGLHAAGANVLLRIAGDGELKEKLLELAQACGLGSRIEFVGFVNDMSSFYGSLDVFALPSLREGLPLTVLEAMASGVPVVATPVGGVPEVIRNGIDGILVPPGDTEALRAALARLMNDGDFCMALGRNARNRVETGFGLDRAASELWTVYQRLLQSRDGGK